jgi:hypothetical protein
MLATLLKPHHEPALEVLDSGLHVCSTFALIKKASWCIVLTAASPAVPDKLCHAVKQALLAATTIWAVLAARDAAAHGMSPWPAPSETILWPFVVVFAFVFGLLAVFADMSSVTFVYLLIVVKSSFD